MKRPIIYGLTALCVLSTPTLITEWKNPTFTKVYRTIASSEAPEFIEKLDPANKDSIESFRSKMQSKLDDFKLAVKQHKKDKSREDFNELPQLEIKRIKKEETRLLSTAQALSTQISKGVEKLSSLEDTTITGHLLSEYNSIETDLKNAVINNEIADSVVVEEIEEKVVLTTEKSKEEEEEEVDEETKNESVQVSTCKNTNAIAELEAQMKSLLEDNEKVVAAASEDDEDKENKKKNKEDKKKDKDKNEHQIASNDFYSMGFLFGRGLSDSFQVPNFRMKRSFPMFDMHRSFSNFRIPTFNPMLDFKSMFTGNRTMASMSNLDHRSILDDNQFRTRFSDSRIEIPKFSRSIIEDVESISLN